ncbi:ATP-binding protein [Streptomyces sp. NPDC059076]|uniref:ATP-binding protein n=1 Tax=unclassified Streptomyces TaxID=2593676 RepID=UPI0036AAF194
MHPVELRYNAFGVQDGLCGFDSVLTGERDHPDGDSEAVANAHRHTPSSVIRVDNLIIEASVLVRVHDDRPGVLPVPADPRADAEHGRGLTLIDACSDAWGVIPLGGTRATGKTVWFVVLTRGSEAV